MSFSRSNVFQIVLTVGLLSAAGLSLAATDAAGAEPPPGCVDCPNSGIKTQKSAFWFGPLMTCGSGISLSKGALTLRDPIDKCPSFVIVEPQRDLPTPKEGFYTIPGVKVPVLEYRFKCASRWLFGWFPVPIGSTCQLESSKELYRLQSYREVACAKSAATAGEGK